MEERRKLDRKYLGVYSRVFDRGTGMLLGYLADLTRTGAMVISDDPVPEHRMYGLRFELPDPKLFNSDHLDLDARVIWCKPDVDPAFNNIGFEFYTVSEQESKTIMEMIKLYEFHRDQPDYPTPPSLL
ncbi:MAG TPA: PilZ domain-containing protein [Anaerolineales bacterium]|jgi:hypothetical protein